MYLDSLLISTHQRKLLQSETTLTSSLQSADLTASIVWARFSFRYLTAASGVPHVDDRYFVLNLRQIATQIYTSPNGLKLQLLRQNKPLMSLPCVTDAQDALMRLKGGNSLQQAC